MGNCRTWLWAWMACLALLLAAPLSAQATVELGDGIDRVELSSDLRYYHDTGGSQTVAAVAHRLAQSEFTPLPRGN